VTESKPSKSARKREQLALQALGEELIALGENELAALDLDTRLFEAIRAAAGIRSRSALRRQRQWIGKLMRDVDPGPIREKLARLRACDVDVKRRFAEAERWRDRLVTGGKDTVTAFEKEAGQQDDELRRLLSELAASPDDRRRKAAQRKIFRRVHAILGRIPQ